MRILSAVALMLGVVACNESGARGVSSPDAAAGPRDGSRALAGPAYGRSEGNEGDEHGGRPVGGSGTIGRLAVWTSPSALGDAPAKIDANGDLVLRPGSAIILLSADGTKCFRLSGDALTKLTPNCPVF